MVWRIVRTTLLFAALALSAGCAGHGSSSDAAPAVSTAQITLRPADGAADVPASGGVLVTAAHGRLTRVRLADDHGTAVPGALTADGRGWQPSAGLAPETRYHLDAVAVDGSGLEAAKHADFTTFVPVNTFVAFYTPDAGSTVGVGTEVSLRFNRPIADRAAVQRAIAVDASPAVRVVGHWFGDRRLDYRPRGFWTSGTHVVLHLRLARVQGAPGVYGTQDEDVPFTIGRSQISTADVAADTLTVVRNGRVLRTLPITAGSAGHGTYQGVMVISQMFPVTRMNSRTVGLGDEYDIPDVPHALRLTDSGTFVHGNYWRPEDVFGHENTSHGCIGLRDTKGGADGSTPAGWFYDHSIIGDVVRVVGSPGGPGEKVAPDNGLSGWNLSWAQWTAGSALQV